MMQPRLQTAIYHATIVTNSFAFVCETRRECSDWAAGLAWPLPLLFAIVPYDVVAFHGHLVLHRTVSHAERPQGPPLLLILGVPISVLSAALFIYATRALLHHSYLRLPLCHIEWLFITPRLHRRCHDPDAALHDLGTIFTVWDRIYGRLIRQDTMPHQPLGVAGELDSFPQQFVPASGEPFRQIRSRSTT